MVSVLATKTCDWEQKKVCYTGWWHLRIFKEQTNKITDSMQNDLELGRFSTSLKLKRTQVQVGRGEKLQPEGRETAA